ncbi:MAG: hypothetical protein ACI8QS_002311 [Planctomycetota bacterium]|jgi:hypothetical protein
MSGIELDYARRSMRMSGLRGDIPAPGNQEDVSSLSLPATQEKATGLPHGGGLCRGGTLQERSPPPTAQENCLRRPGTTKHQPNSIGIS